MRVFSVLGPSNAGKSTLVESLVGLDGSPGKTFTVRGVAAVRCFGFMGEDWAAVDIAGGAENLGPIGAALAASDIAVICMPADAGAAVLAAPYLRIVEDAGIPGVIFINRLDNPQSRISEVVSELQAYSRHHIVLREVPIRDGDKITGFVDLVSERAWKFEDGKPSVLTEMPDSVKQREAEARAELLESYADFDDQLMEELIEDRQPLVGEVYDIAARTLRDHDLLACFMGSASEAHGITRLMKSLRHDAPGVEAARDRLGADAVAVGALADVIPHLGKVVLLRAIGAPVTGGKALGGGDLGSVTDLDARTALPDLTPGRIGLAVKSDHLAAGRILTRDAARPLPDWAAGHAGSFRRIVTAEREKDDGRLQAALDRLAEIDPGLSIGQDETTGAPVLATQGPIHLRHILGKIGDNFGIAVTQAAVPPILRETIRRGTEVQHRHRKQTGGAGQFADVVIALRPAGRGAGVVFSETVKGGAVPRNYLPAVEAGARDALKAGPRGFPVVDVEVELKDGKAHSVDSSDHSFRTAGQNAVREALAEAGTIVLEPIMRIDIQVPSIFSGALVPLVSGLKGQVLGFEAHESAAGWDVFGLLLPMAQEEDLFTALAGATRGTAWFTSAFDHYQEARTDGT